VEAVTEDYRLADFALIFFFPVGLAPGLGMSAVGLTASRPRSASRSLSGMRIVVPGFATSFFSFVSRYNGL